MKMLKLALKLFYINYMEKNYDKLINIDTESITYEELYNNSLIEKHYKEILAKLDDVCILDNLLSVKNSY